MSELMEFRLRKDEFFARHHDSPLSEEQRAAFTGLSYYDEATALRFEVPVALLPEAEPLEIILSTGEVEPYLRWGRLTFALEGQDVTLTVFQSMEERLLFLPFRDATAAAGETYGAGRYLEPEVSPSGRLIIDFNYAYNPYCAYNDLFACPLTPPENVISVPIRAGEKLPPWAH